MRCLRIWCQAIGRRLRRNCLSAWWWRRLWASCAYSLLLWWFRWFLCKPRHVRYLSPCKGVPVVRKPRRHRYLAWLEGCSGRDAHTAVGVPESFVVCHAIVYVHTIILRTWSTAWYSNSLPSWWPAWRSWYRRYHQWVPVRVGALICGRNTADCLRKRLCSWIDPCWHCKLRAARWSAWWLSGIADDRLRCALLVVFWLFLLSATTVAGWSFYSLPS